MAAPESREEIFAGFEGAPPLFYKTTLAGVPVFRTSPNRLEFFNDQTFPARKSGLRVVTFGESTTYGEPWGYRGSFSRYLREALARARPESVEVVNMGGKGYGSTAILRLVREALDYRPDAFVFYVGHNEFREAAFHPLERAGRSALPSWHAGLYTHSRTYAALWNLARKRLPRRGGVRPTSFATQEVARILGRPFGPGSFTFPPRLAIPPLSAPDTARPAVLDVFENNFKQMLEVAAQNGIPCFVFTVVRNEAYWLAPNRSALAPGAETSAYEERYRSLLTAVGSGRFAESLALADSVAALYAADGDDYLRVLRGDLFLVLGRPREAEESYRSAWLPDDVNERIRRAASSVAGVGAVPPAGAFRAPPVTLLESRPAARSAAPDSILGFSVFYDELHPVPEIHRALGEMAAAAIAADLAPAGSPPAREAAAVSPLPDDPDGEVLAYEALRAMYLDRWDDAERAAGRALAMAPRLGKASVYEGICAARRGDMKKAREAWERLARLYPEFVVTSSSSSE